MRQVLYSIESTEAKKSRGYRIIDEYGLVSGLTTRASAALAAGAWRGVLQRCSVEVAREKRAYGLDVH